MLQFKKLTQSCLLSVAFVLSACVLCSAQTTTTPTAPASQQNHAAPQDSDTLKALEITNIRLAAANETIRLLNDRLSAKDEIIKAKEGTIAVRDEQLALAKSANQDRSTVNAGDARMMEADRKILAACEAQLSKADARIWSLEHPGLLRQIFNTDTLAKVGAGFLLNSVINK